MPSSAPVSRDHVASSRSRRVVRVALGLALAAGLPASAEAQGTAAPSPTPAAARLRFDFGTPTSPVAEGYVQVTESTTYSRKRGYGWHDGDEVMTRDRERGDALRRDLAVAQWAEFLVDVPNGTYDVTVTMGDAGAAHEAMGLLIQGRRVESVTTAAGQFWVKTYRAAVAGGQLSVVLDDLGGEDVNAVINALEIKAVAQP